MTTELTLLALSAALMFVQMCTTAGAITLLAGFNTSLGNRAGFVPEEGPLARSIRALRNMAESFPVFAAAVLVVHAAGREGGLSTLGAELFLAGRVAYWGLYVGGVPFLRTGPGRSRSRASCWCWSACFER